MKRIFVLLIKLLEYLDLFLQEIQISEIGLSICLFVTTLTKKQYLHLDKFEIRYRWKIKYRKNVTNI